MLKIFNLIILILIILIFYNSCCTTENFDIKKTKIKVYNYYTSWCGWSQKFLPEWNTFVNTTAESNNIETISIQCDDPKNIEKCSSVPGFPSIIIEANDKTVNYEGGRTSNEIHEFIKNNYLLNKL